jgi:hypothetical protein
VLVHVDSKEKRLSAKDMVIIGTLVVKVAVKVIHQENLHQKRLHQEYQKKFNQK